MKRSLALRAAAALSLVAVLACDKATPVAPEGTILTVTASPTRIGLTGSSVVTVVGRKGNGQPLNPGTEIRFSSDKGTVTPVVATINDSGVATATLQADGRSGIAKVTAATAAVTATVDVQVGETTDTKPVLIVSASPNNVPVGGESTITIIARNGDGTPVGSGQQVILTSTLGSLSPGRPLTRTDGTAVSTLQVGNQAGTATITAILGSSDPQRTDVTIRDAATDISIQANPATVPPAGGDITLTAFVTNSQGQPLQGAPVTFESQRGTLSTTGVVFTNTSGVATNELTLTQQELNGVTSFTVTASTPSGTGALLDDTTTVRVQ